jgi:hypothetical protein
MKLKSIAFLLAYSALFLPIWGMSMFRPDMTTNYLPTFAALIYTAVSPIFVQQSAFFRAVKYANAYVLSAPVVYFVATFLMLPFDFSVLLNPVIWAFVVILFAQLLKPKVEFRYLFLACFFSFFYSYQMYPMFTKHLNAVTEKEYRTTHPEEKIKE